MTQEKKVVPKGRTGTLRTLQIFWGILTLLSLGWMCFGTVLVGQSFNKVVSVTPTEAIIRNTSGTPIATVDPDIAAAGTAIGASIGGGIGLTFFLCTGIPVFLFCAFLYWRNGVALRSERQHAERLAAEQRL